MDQKYIVTLELSGTQIKGAVASVSKHPNGTPTLPTIEAIITEDNADCIQYGRVQNIINAANLTKDVLRRLQAEPILTDGAISCAYVAIAGRSLGSERTSAEISLPSELVITQDILRDLYVEAAKNADPNKKVLKVLPRKFYVDNQAMQAPVGALGSKFRGDFTLVTCNPVNQRNLDLILSDKDRVNLPVEEYIITPLAIADMVLDEEEKQLGCVLVDFGHQTTTVSIYKDRALQYLVTMPMGSQNITRDISMGLNVTMEKAENDKIVNGNAIAPNTGRNDEITRINNYVSARAYEIAANINANIGYAKYKASDLPCGFVLVGRGARLNNFDTLLSNISKMPVRTAKVPTNVNFAFNTATIRPEDYMSLIAIILRVSRNQDFANCISFKSEETPQLFVTDTDSDTESDIAGQAIDPKVEQPEPVHVITTPNIADEDDWDKDDEERSAKQSQKRKSQRRDEHSGSFLKSLRDRVIKMVSADPMDDDANLNDN